MRGARDNGMRRGIVTLLAALLLVGCGGGGGRGGGRVPTATAPPVAFNPAPWRQGERTTYAIQDRGTGQQVGQATFVLGREFETDSLSANVTINQTQDRYQMGFNTRTFQPTSELRTVSTAQGTFEIRAEYHEGGATIEV